MAPRNRPDRTDDVAPEELVAAGAVPDPGTAPETQDAPAEELAAEPPETSPDESVEDVTAADAAVESYRRNNPEPEAAEGEGE